MGCCFLISFTHNIYLFYKYIKIVKLIQDLKDVKARHSRGLSSRDDIIPSVRCLSIFPTDVYDLLSGPIAENCSDSWTALWVALLDSRGGL